VIISIVDTLNNGRFRNDDVDDGFIIPAMVIIVCP
jgi:hypothetical protein